MYSSFVRQTSGESLLPPPRQQVAKEINSGDDSARFKGMVLPHLGDAYSLARWITGSRADAEDVVQDACLRAFRAIVA
jgi:DNA-directed RNA polymerase specialized sigma24 family protein